MTPKAPCANCAECPLANEPVVRGRGPTLAKIALVGEGPGKTELRLGKPFVGESGHLLDLILKRIKVNAADVWITNAVLCRCVTPSGENRPPTPQEIKCCHSRLVAELKTHSVERAITLGASAAQSLVSSKVGITKRRGQVVETADGLRVLTTYHPAYVLRQHQMFPELLKDLKAGFNGMNLSTVAQFETKVIDTMLEAHYTLEIIYKTCGPALAFDLETNSLDFVTGKIVCVILSPRPDTSYIFPIEVLANAKNRKLLRAILESRLVVGHNLKFDLKFLAAEFDIFPQEIFDTLVAHYALDERRGVHGLKAIAADRYHAPDWETPVAAELKKLPKEARNYGAIPRDVLYKYAGFDGHYTLRLYYDLWAEIQRSPRLTWLFTELLMPAMRVLTKMEMTGMRLDRKHLETTAREWAKELIAAESALNVLAGHEFNPRSTAQLSLVLAELGLPIILNKDTKKPTTAKAALQRLTEIVPTDSAGFKFLTALLDYRQLQKLQSTYILPLTAEAIATGRGHTQFNLAGTITGRLSAEDRNLLNIPRSGSYRGKAVKNSYIADKGKILVQGDLKGAEVATAAWYSNDATLIKLLKAGTDVHGAVAAVAFGPQWTREQRQIAKTSVFAQLYGQLLRSLAQRLHHEMIELGLAKNHDEVEAIAKRVVDAIQSMFPTVRDWQRAIVKKAFKDGGLETVFGRRRRYPLVSAQIKRDLRNQALNYLIQSTASDLVMLALIEVAPIIEAAGGDVLLSVYDSIIVQVPESKALWAARIVRDAMLSVPQRMLGDKVPFAVEMSMGYRWGELKEIKEL